MTQRRLPRWPQPDFLGQRQRLGGSMFFLVGGVVALLACGVGYGRQQAELDRLSAPRLSSSSPAASRRDAVIAPGAGDLEAQRAAHRVAASLEAPWNELFASIEAATPAGVQWLRLDFTAASGDLRLDGETADTGTALRVVDRLASQRSWRDVALVRWQRPEPVVAASSSAPARSQPSLRFAIEAVRQSAAPISAVTVSERR